jgi:hypothetical protein
MDAKFAIPFKSPHLCGMKALINYLEAGMPNSMGFDDYIALTEQLAAEGKTTGPNQSEVLIHFTKLNLTRMRRIVKSYAPSAEITRAIEALPPQTWMVITEPWCGDAAQTVPMMATLAALNPNINLRLILRDSHADIMDLFLTDGGKGIPKLVAISPENGVLFHWGPRPAQAQQMVRDYKAMPEPKPEYLKFAESVQKWYLADAGKSFEAELIDLLK